MSVYGSKPYKFHDTAKEKKRKIHKNRILFKNRVWRIPNQKTDFFAGFSDLLAILEAHRLIKLNQPIQIQDLSTANVKIFI